MVFVRKVLASITGKQFFNLLVIFYLGIFLEYPVEKMSKV